MNSIAVRVGAILIVAGLGFYPQNSLADAFTGKDFSKWSETGQDSFIQASVTMAGVVLTRTQPDKARCIDGWYGGDDKKAERNASIRKTIADYGDYHPSGTILAIIEQACGPLK